MDKLFAAFMLILVSVFILPALLAFSSNSSNAEMTNDTYTANHSANQNTTGNKDAYACEGGVPYGSCSPEKPLQCHDGVLKSNCSACGCSAGLCAADGKCYENHPPVLGRIGDREIREGEKLELTAHAEDPDGDFVAIYVSGLPAGASFDRKTGKFSWTPSYNQTGNYWVTFSVVDDGMPPLGGQEMVRITVGDVNRPPGIEPLDARKTDENVLLRFFVQASDPDGDAITYFAEGLPQGAGFNNRTGEFYWVPEFGQEGNYKVRFAVSDGSLSAAREIVITVGNVNRPPGASISYPLGSQQFFAGSAVPFSGAGSSDSDGDKLYYEWDFGDGENASSESSMAGHVYKSPGRYKVKLAVGDGMMEDTAELEVSVVATPPEDMDGDGVDDARDKCPDTPPLREVNAYGCPLPKYTEFSGNTTTDFSNVDLTNATDVVLAVTEKARIEFRSNTLDLAGKNLDKYIEMGDMNITVRTEMIPELNRSAVITFYNVTIENPVILKDGAYCTECRIISHENRTLVFSVPHFTTYSLLSWISFSGYCGDGICSIYEACTLCKEDCGTCKEGGSQAPGECREIWVCSAWSKCNELNLMTRECTEIGLCGTRTSKPAEAMECGKGGFESPSFIPFAVIVILLVFAYLISETYKKRKENVKMDKFELEKFVKGYVYHGYSSEEIRKLLEAKGYKGDDIEKVLKDVKKGIF